MNTLAYKNILKGNWEEIKGQLQSKWAKLTDDDLDQIDGSYKKLTGQLQKTYGYKLAEVEEEIADFFDSGNFEKMKLNAIHKVREIKEIVSSTLDEYFQTLKQKTFSTEQAVIEYTRDNPVKVIGFAALTGLLIGCICKNSK